MSADQLSSDLASLRIDRGGPSRGTSSPGPRPPGGGGGRAARRVATWVVALALVGGGGWVAWQKGKPWAEAQFFKVEVDVTEVASVSPVQASVELTSTGYVVPQLTAKIGAKVIGRITEAHLKEGEQVKAGQVLYKIDPTDQERIVTSAHARVASARARTAAARAQVEEIRVQHRRQKQLAAQGAAPAATVEDLEARIVALEAQVAAADAEAKAAAAEASASSSVLKSFVVEAPIDGVVMGKPGAVGDVTFPEGPLAEIADFSTLLVETDVPEGRLHLVRPGGPVEIVLDAMPGERFPGTVVGLGPRLNRSKATGTVKVKFDQPPELLRPEMSARVSFLAKKLDDEQRKAKAKVVLPAAAVVDRAGSKAVFVVDQGKVRLVPVELGPAFGTGFEVIEGPSPGTRVVKQPPPVLADGQAVKEKSS